MKISVDGKIFGLILDSNIFEFESEINFGFQLETVMKYSSLRINRRINRINRVMTLLVKVMGSSMLHFEMTSLN